MWESAKVVLGEENLKLGINVRISRERSERKIFWTLFASEASEKIFWGGGSTQFRGGGGRGPFRGGPRSGRGGGRALSQRKP